MLCLDNLMLHFLYNYFTSLYMLLSFHLDNNFLLDNYYNYLLLPLLYTFHFHILHMFMIMHYYYMFLVLYLLILHTLYNYLYYYNNLYVLPSHIM